MAPALGPEDRAPTNGVAMQEAVKLPPTATLFEYEFHELANLFPLVEGEDYSALIEDIRDHGILNPITLYQGRILDGRNRYRAAKESGHKFTPRDFVELAPNVDAREYVLSANVQRRQLKPEQRRQLVAKLIRKTPTESNRAIAKLAACDDKTVADERRKMEAALAEFMETWRGFCDWERTKFIAAFREDLRRLT